MESGQDADSCFRVDVVVAEHEWGQEVCHNAVIKVSFIAAE